AKLESSEGWINWNEEIRDLLALSGYDDLLERKRDPPVQGNLSDVAFEEKLDAWHQRQARACGAVRYRLGFRPRQEVQVSGCNNRTKTKRQSSTLLWSLPSRSKISRAVATARSLGIPQMPAGYFTQSLRNA
ncbi:hypothetical protein H9L39_19721, partial [Fusarium oxysporum f. sp. albedinis]